MNIVETDNIYLHNGILFTNYPTILPGYFIKTDALNNQQFLPLSLTDIPAGNDGDILTTTMGEPVWGPAPSGSISYFMRYSNSNSIVNPNSIFAGSVIQNQSTAFGALTAGGFTVNFDGLYEIMVKSIIDNADTEGYLLLYKNAAMVESGFKNDIPVLTNSQSFFSSYYVSLVNGDEIDLRFQVPTTGTITTVGVDFYGFPATYISIKKIA